MTAPQQQAIEKVEGPTVILAGAGTGKSYTVKKKANHLVNELQLYKPSEILCLTFSNEATNDLKRGMQEELKTTESVEVKTFHAFCGDVLREHGHLIGIDEGFEIILPDDAKVIMHKFLGVQPYWANRYVSTIMNAKDFGLSIKNIKEYANSLISSPDYEDKYKQAKEFLQTFYLLSKEEQKDNKDSKKEYAEFTKNVEDYNKFQEFISAWEKYDQYKKEHAVLDFSDLNQYTLEYFREYGAEEYTEQFKYVFVDEFQDTNKLQFELISFIAEHKNITVVGDLNQSIYGFRGSYRESFEQFIKDFGADDSCIFKLEKGRRSPDSVLSVSYDLIKHNYENEDDCVRVHNYENREGDNVEVISFVNAEEEARFIANKVQERIDAGISLDKICILHRTHKQAEIIKQALELKEIPVISAGKIDLLQKPEIKTAVAYISILANLIERSSTGEQAWWHLFHYKNTLSVEDSVKIGRYIKKLNKRGTPIEEQKGIDEILLNSITDLDLSEQGKVIVSKIVSRLKELLSASAQSLPDLVLEVYDIIGLNRAFSHERSIANIESMLNLKKFHELASQYYEKHETSIQGFVTYLEMIDDLGVNIDASKIMHVDAVRMMTIHASKGLEFDTVFVCNMAKDRFPIGRTKNEPLIPKELLPDFKAQIDDWKEEGLSDKDIAKKVKEYDKDIFLTEERRLCYVAWTRTENKLFLTYAKSYNGQPDSTTASPFLDEIKYLEHPSVTFSEDVSEEAMILSPSSAKEQRKSMLKNQLLHALENESYEDIAKRLAKFLSVREESAIFPTGIDMNSEELEKEILTSRKESVISFDKNSVTFSPSSLISYSECPKKYELSQVLRMPEKKLFDDESEGGNVMGSFVHKVCEIGVDKGVDSYEGYVEIAKEEHKGEFATCNMDDALWLIKVFWQRNKHKLLGNSQTEMELILEMDGFRFYGLADRVDTLDDGTVEIIDYKTNKHSIDSKKRRIQLGFYAIALMEKGFKVSKLTLDMLKLDKPVEMTVEDDDVKGPDGRTKGFKISEVKEEILELCRSIANDYEKGFAVTDNENACRFCSYKFYCPKWEE